MGESLLNGRRWWPGARTLALPLMAATVVGCSSGLRVITDFDPEADLTVYRTYQWAERREVAAADARVDNDIIGARIRLAVDSVLQAKGFTKVAAAPDFLVGWHAAIDRRISVTEMSAYYPYGWGRYGRRGPAGVRVDRWEEGTVLIDVVDAERGEVVWRGSGSAKLRDEKDAAKRQELLIAAVVAILRDFPPGGGG